MVEVAVHSKAFGDVELAQLALARDARRAPVVGETLSVRGRRVRSHDPTHTATLGIVEKGETHE